MALFGVAAASAPAQAPHPLTPAQTQHINDIIGKMTVEEKIDYIGGTGFAVRALPGVHLPALEMSDGPYGVRSNVGLPSTTYAEGIGLAASWDRSLAQAVGGGIGRDARARGIHYMLGPGTNIYRSPRNGRNFEYFGEDPFLAGEMDAGYITGMQAQGVSATVKHYIGNNSEYLRHDSDSVIDERTLHEIYLVPFEAAVKKGQVGAVMDSYNLINGSHATQNPVTNIEILRHDWHFPGTLMSDWDATYDGVAAANGGLDLEMPTGKFMNRKTLLPALQAGKVTQATLDEKIRHILTTAEMFGWLDRTQRDPSISLFDAQNNAVALKAARESVTLLKNDNGVLPLNKQAVHTILLVGPNAYPGTPVGGGSAGVVPFHSTSLLEGVSQVAPGATVLYDPGLPTLSDLASHTNFTTAENGGKPGLTEEVFGNRDLSGAPAKTLNPMHINVSGIGWENIAGSLDDLMAIFNRPPAALSHRYTGYFKANEGDYLLALAGAGENNGDRVLLDGHLVIDDWRYVRAFEPHLTMHLAAGTHKIVVESWQRGLIGGRLRFAIAPADSVVSQRAKELAAHADAVVVAAGFYNNRDTNTESEGGDRTFDLPFGQDALIRAMEAANPRTVVAVTSGGAVDASSWIDATPALMEAWYGGQAGGQALAEALFGDINPAGHLPITWERKAEDNPTYANYYPQDDGIEVQYKEGIFVGYRGYEKAGTKPLFPFGYGLSYTAFSFSHLRVRPGGSGGSLATVEFDVTNAGKRAGAVAAQVYVSEPGAKEPRPAHELKGFNRVELAPGKSSHVSMPLEARAFAWYNPDLHTWTVDPGRFTISVGDSLSSLPLSGDVEITPAMARAEALSR